jgi:hypothetical protein
LAALITVLKRRRTVTRSAVPFASEYTAVNACVVPEPELGARDTIVSGPATGVQVPFGTQPLFNVSPTANRYTFFAPVNVPLKVNATTSVALLPEGV